MRVKYECLYSLYSLTLTLTYDDENLPKLVPYYVHPFDPGSCDEINEAIKPEPDYYFHPIDLDHVQRFFKRLRKKYQFRYFGVGEYGSKRGRPHYHIIVFFNRSYDWRKFRLDVYRNWPYGVQVTIDETNDDCIGYTLKYCLKPYTSIDPNPKIFCSKRPFIGYMYLEKNEDYIFDRNNDGIVSTIAGKYRLPRIYMDKIFTPIMEDRRELIKASILSYLEEQETKDKLTAYERGMTIQEFNKLKRDIFTEKVWKQIKKKSL